MLSLRVSRDKRGYDLIYLVWDQRRRGRPEPRLLYCCRLPAPLRVGPPPFDDDVRRMLEEAHPEIPFDWPGLLKSVLGAVNTPRPTTTPAPPFRSRRNGPPSPSAAAPSSTYSNGHRPPPRGAPPSPPPVNARGNGHGNGNSNSSWTAPPREVTTPEPQEIAVPWIEVRETIVEVRHSEVSPVETPWRSPASSREDAVIEDAKEEDTEDGVDADSVSSTAETSEAGAADRQRRRRRRRRGGRGREGATSGRAAGEGEPSTGGPSSGGSDSD